MPGARMNSIKDVPLYERLVAKPGYSKEKAARIANSVAKKRRKKRRRRKNH